jgi:hypothetical protein
VELGKLEGAEMPGARTSKKGGAAPITVNQEILRASGLVRRLDRPMKVLGGGDLSSAMFVVADAFSASARAKIEGAGGTVSILETPETKRPAVGVDSAPAGKIAAPASEAALASEAAPPSGPVASEASTAEARTSEATTDVADAPGATPESQGEPADEAVAETPTEAPKRASRGKRAAAASSDDDEPAAARTRPPRKPRAAKPQTDA